MSPREISESLWTQDPAWPTEGRLLPCIAGHHPDVIFLGGAQAGRSCCIWARGRVLGGAVSLMLPGSASGATGTARGAPVPARPEGKMEPGEQRPPVTL